MPCSISHRDKNLNNNTGVDFVQVYPFCPWTVTYLTKVDLGYVRSQAASDELQATVTNCIHSQAAKNTCKSRYC